ncbi:MAG: hypothetical protein QOJ42_8243 [Acidobacteriaceae bacterium]|nr:hypothetical protein [Acidobacteriaceae bacterium]
MVHDRLLDPAHLAPYATLILPNLAALSDTQCDQLRAFVKNAGNVIATHQTSLYDEWGVRRGNFGLADLFGVGPMLNSYIRLEHEAQPHHILFSGLEDAPRVINGVSHLEVTPRETFAETPLTLIPCYPDLPMEKVYPRTTKTDTSYLYLRQSAAYFPCDIDLTFWEMLCADHLKLPRNAVLWANLEAPVVEVQRPGFLDGMVWKTLAPSHSISSTSPILWR